MNPIFEPPHKFMQKHY